ncbi:D-alanyl-D-alanine carboxypeptidase [Streptomyces sp. AC555_RSS877]|uniref:D-alanyl-D-alanine carboxypeptidase n=1 Tax=Streptomyces sp. AC555_RSS877 TaxID=2823688 RepID=UPI001C259E67|nr:D-alanyl-D-alanine carboxypeptidase [Streptomyces sp. AC555_RSS877]
MAGESPDRSKKRESSAEPTSGSAGPVPEARTESSQHPEPPEKRDPRLAVARDSGTASTARGGVDTATRVFSVRELTADAQTAEETPETAEEPERAEEPAQDAAEPQTGDTGAEGAGTAAQAATEADTDAAEATEPEADTGEGTQAAAPRAEDAEAPEADTAAPTTDPEATEPAHAAEDAEEPRTEDAGTPEADTGEGTQAAAPRAEDAEDAEAPEADAADAQAENADADAGDSSAGDRDEAPAAGDVRLRDAVAAWVASADEKADTGDADDTEDGAEAETDADAGTDSPEAEVGAEAEAADSKADGTAQPESDDEPSSDAEEEADGDAETTGTPESDTPEDVEDAKPSVDQPTAVFKAVRPPAPAVDQPTTMLKLGDAARKPKPKPEASESAEASEAPKAPEPPAERTSKFVALKPLDDSATRKAAPADATSALPQVGPERTTQQPLPPRPPLDLLAELTNTPPPPETPVRTIVRRVKIWTPLALLLAVVFAIVQAVRPLPAPELTLTADESYTFEGSEAALPWPSEGQGRMDVNGIGTMGDFGKQTPVAIGSVAKAMTAYVVLKDHPLKSGAEGPNIPVDATAEKEGGYNKDGESTLNTIKQGDNLTLRQAITAIMIPSANNVARLLARWDADTEAAFIKKMNDAAKDLGMKNTTYTDASGLKETTVSTAEDQVKLGNELVKMPALMEITSMGQWIDPSGQKWYNYNYLVPYNGAIGIKTGTTTAAGGNLLFAARKEVGGETVTLVGAILGQHKAPIIKTVNDVSRVAMLAAQDAMTSAKILKKGDVVGYVDDGLGGQTPVVVTKDVTAVGWAGFKVKLSFASDDVPHTAKAGTKVGTLTVGDGSGGAVKVPVALQRDLVEPGYTDKLTRLG